jgi:tryptophan synthase beta chain
MQVTTHPSKEGYYGIFGGAYIPEMLYGNIEQLTSVYQQYIDDAIFQKEYQALLKDYVGRPTPLYFAQRLSEKYGIKLIILLGNY